MNEPLKYIVYARKSSESEEKQVQSIDDQLAEINKLALKEGLSIVHVITEEKSAKQPGRIGFNELTEQLRKGVANGIICWKLNRLARNPVDGGQISWLLQKGVIKHIKTFERSYYPSDNVLMMSVELGMANQYVKDLSVDVKRGMRRKAERGWFPSPRLPLGYVHNQAANISKGEPEIILDTKKYKLVKKLWQLYLSGGYSIRELTDEMNRCGLTNHQGKPLSWNKVKAILKHPFYSGSFYWRNEDGQLALHKGKHQTMISKSSFQDAQKILNGKAIETRPQSYEFKYRGSISCGECGSAITPDRKIQVICTGCKKKFSAKHRIDCSRCSLLISDMQNPSKLDITYYRCTKKKGDCHQRGLREEEIERQIIEHAKDITFNQNTYAWVMRMLRMVNKDLAKDTSTLEREKQQIVAEVNELYMMRARKELTGEKLKELAQDLQKTIDRLEKEIRVNSTLCESWISRFAQAHNYLLELPKRLKKGSQISQKRFLNILCSNLVLQDKKLYFTMRKCFLGVEILKKKVDAKLASLEPKKGVVLQHDLDQKLSVLGLNFSMLAELRQVRTLLTDENEKPSYK